MAERMIITDMTVNHADLAPATLGVEPPFAPMTMPKQVLTRSRGPVWRSIATVLTLLRRDLGRVS